MKTYEDILNELPTDEARERFLNSRAPYGLRTRDLVEVGAKQVEGTDLKTFTPNNVHNLKDMHFIADGIDKVRVDEHEFQIFYVAQESRSFHPVTGEKVSKARVQKYDAINFELMEKNRGFEGKTVFILHDPRLPLTPEMQAYAAEKGWSTK